MAEKQTIMPVPKLGQASLEVVGGQFEAPVQSNGLFELAKILGKADDITAAIGKSKAQDALYKEAMELQGLPREQIMEKLKEEDLDYYTRAARNKILGERIAREITAESQDIQSNPDVTDVNAALNERIDAWGLGDITQDKHFFQGFYPVMESTRAEFTANQAKARRSNDIENILADSTAVATDEISKRVTAGDLDSIPEYLGGLATSLSEKHIGIPKDNFDQSARLAIARRFATVENANPSAIEAIFKLTNKQSLLTHPKFGDDAQRILKSAQGAMLDRQQFAYGERMALWEAMADEGKLTGTMLEQFRQEAKEIPGLVTPEKYTSILTKQNKKDLEFREVEDAKKIFYQNPTAPLTGDQSKDEKLRKKITADTMQSLDDLVARKQMTPQAAFLAKVKAVTDWNQPNEQWKDQLGIGASAALPQYADPKAVIPDSVKQGVALYRLLSQQAPHTLAAHSTNDDTKQFYTSVNVAMDYQGMDVDQAIRQAISERIPNPEADSRYQGISSQTLAEDVASLNTIYDGWLPFDSVTIQNSANLAPAYERTVKRFIRLGLSQDKARDAAKKDLKNNVVVIGDMAFPKGSLLAVPDKVQNGNKLIAQSWLETAGKDSGYDDDDLNLAPNPAKPNSWFLINKLNMMPVASYSTDEISQLVDKKILKKK